MKTTIVSVLADNIFVCVVCVVFQAVVAEIKASLDAKDQELEELRAKVNNNRKLSKEEEQAIQGKADIRNVKLCLVSQSNELPLTEFIGVSESLYITDEGIYMKLCLVAYLTEHILPPGIITISFSTRI